MLLIWKKLSMLSLSYFLCLPDGSVSGCGTNPGLRRPVPAICRIFCSNVRGLAWNLTDLTVASSQYDILLCSEALVSDMRHVSELLVLGCIRTRWLRSISSTKIWVWLLRNAGFRVCGVRQNFYVQSLPQPWPDDRIFDCLLASMAACRLRMPLPLSCMWVIWMAIIRSGWVIRKRKVMELHLLTSQLSPVAISWLSKTAWPIRVPATLTRDAYQRQKSQRTIIDHSETKPQSLGSAQVICRHQEQDTAGQGKTPHPETEESGKHKK